MIRLIATDVDGTIAADGSCEINPEYYTVIRKLRALGIQVAAASGRQKDSLLDLFAPVKEKIFYISNNGAGLGCWNRELYVQGMPPELIHELMADVAKLPDCQMILSGVDTCFYSPETEDWFIRYLREDYRFEALPLPENMEEIDLSGIVKIAVYHDPSDTEPHPAVPLIRKMEGRLSGMVSGREWVDFMAPGVSKGRALACLQESLQIGPEETMVFGDQMNDISMLQRAVHSFAVGGARPEVKAAAAHVTAPREEDGVLQIWKKLADNQGEYQGE